MYVYGQVAGKWRRSLRSDMAARICSSSTCRCTIRCLPPYPLRIIAEYIGSNSGNEDGSGLNKVDRVNKTETEGDDVSSQERNRVGDKTLENKRPEPTIENSVAEWNGFTLLSLCCRSMRYRLLCTCIPIDSYKRDRNRRADTRDTIREADSLYGIGCRV